MKLDGKGYKVGKNIVPLVPSAVIFDLIPENNYWENEISIWKRLENFKSFCKNFKLGSSGAGYAATTST